MSEGGSPKSQGTSLVSGLDAYEFRARLAPGLLVIAPVIAATLATGIRDRPLVTGFVSAFMAIGGPLLAASFVRDKGLQQQPALWARWGGPPTTDLLRASRQDRDTVRKERRRHLEGVTSLQLPTTEDEERDSEAADSVYNAAVRSLIGKTRERPKFELVFIENQSYGYWRNMLGIRSFGRAVAVITTVVLIGDLLYTGAVGDTSRILDLLLGLLVSVGWVALWIWVPTEERVHRAATAYAERLLDAAEQVDQS